MSSARACEDQSYFVDLADDTLFVYVHITSAAEVNAIDREISLLGAFPYAGVRYEPCYSAAVPSEPLRVIYAGHHALYYKVADETKVVTIVYIEDQRRDPAKRFTDIEGFYG